MTLNVCLLQCGFDKHQQKPESSIGYPHQPQSDQSRISVVLMKTKGKGHHFLLLSWMGKTFHRHHFEGGLGPDEKSRGKEVFVWGGVRALERLAVQVFCLN